jgi:glycosyltransferase involved in cell wall biosynthesis
MSVSVIIPAFNAERFIAETITSALSQTYRSLEVIVVDDGSSDQTATLVRQIQNRDSRLFLYQQENRGSADARNTGIAHSKGELIAFLDADDLWHPTKIAKQVSAFKRDPNVGLVYAWSRMIDAEGMIDGVTGASHTVKGDVFNHFLVVNPVANGSVAMVRRDCLPLPPAFDPELKGLEDSYFYMRVAANHKVDYVPEYLVGYRWNTGVNTSSNLRVQEFSHSVFIKKLLSDYPDTPKRFVKWSAAGLRFSHAQVSAKKGEYRKAIQLLVSAFSQSGTFVFSPLFRRSIWLVLRHAYRKIRRAPQHRQHFFQASPKASQSGQV